MEELVINILFWGVFVGGGTLFAIFVFMMAIKQYKRDMAKPKEVDSNNNTASIEQKFSPIMIKATVIDLTCCVKTIGIKTPKTMKEFSVIFQTKNGDIIKLNVPEEMYDGFIQGQIGTLSLVDGELYGFELEENNSVI